MALFLFSYLGIQVGHAQTTGLAGVAADQAGNLKPLAIDASAAVTRDDNQSLDQAGPASAGDVVTVNPAVTHQTMRGWEVTAQADHYRPDYAAFQNAALDKVVELASIACASRCGPAPRTPSIAS